MDKCLSFYLSAQAERTPYAPALTGDKGSYDYFTLEQDVRALAEILTAMTPEKQRRIGVYLDDKFDVFIAMLAIFRADLVYVPIDVTLPFERCRYMINDSDLAFVITDPVHASALMQEGVRTLFMNTPRQGGSDSRLQRQKRPRGIESAEPDRIAYVLYTSGSTGMPKGVEMPHKSIANLIDDQLENDALFRRPLRTLQFASPGFDVSCQEVLSCLAVGGELVIAPDDIRADTSKLFEFIRVHELERAFLPYSVLQTLAIEYERQEAKGPGAFIHMITAGEQLLMTKEIIKWLSRLDCRLINHYGPTETHVVTTYSNNAPFDRWPYHVPIGKAIGNVQAYILNELLQPCAMGEDGELCVGGACLSKGYINPAADSHDKYIEILTPSGKAQRVYRTGDIAQINEAGEIIYKGRRDTQIKLNGYRVELGEVEAGLKSIPEVKEAVAVVRQLGESSVEKVLIGLVVLTGRAWEGPLEIDEVDAAYFSGFIGKLPAFMQPKQMYAINKIPVTSNGKLDRRAIEALLDARINSTSLGFNENEAVVAKLFSKLLGISVTSLETDFFEKGGNSLLAVRFVKALEDQCGVRINLSSFLLRPNVKNTASLIKVG